MSTFPPCEVFKKARLRPVPLLDRAAPPRRAATPPCKAWPYGRTGAIEQRHLRSARLSGPPCASADGGMVRLEGEGEGRHRDSRVARAILRRRGLVVKEPISVSVAAGRWRWRST